MRLNKSLFFILLMISFNSKPMQSSIQSTRSNFSWPILDSNKNNIHKTMINSLLTKEVGCKYKGHWFTLRGNSVDHQFNQPIYTNAQVIIDLMNEGHQIQILPTCSEQEYSRYRHRCRYKILLDGQPYFNITFRVYQNNQENLPVRPQQTQRPRSLPGSENIVPTSFDNPELSAHKLGHGAVISSRYSNAVSNISRLIQQNCNHPVLTHAFSIVEGADLADAQDILLLKNLITNSNNAIHLDQVINAIDKDITLLKKVKSKANTRNSTTAFRDQLKEMITFGTLTKAKSLIVNNQRLLHGIVPSSYTHAKGGKILCLRAALFYIASVKDRQGLNQIIHYLSGFYPETIPHNTQISSLLNRTRLVSSRKFITPACSYVKNANVVSSITPIINNLPLERGRRQNNFNMHFADCSGFVAHVARLLFPGNSWLAHNRFSTWHLMGAYDSMVQQQTGDSLFHGIGGSGRPLTSHEKNQIRNFRNSRGRCSAMTKIFKPVFNSSNLRPGDVIVYRHPHGSVEGHAVIVVDPHVGNGNIVVIELTRADVGGTRHGYVWRKLKLNQGYNRPARVLRFKV